jgi:pimeloyl-ACP methyl ester carboxylesterase
MRWWFLLLFTCNTSIFISVIFEYKKYIVNYEKWGRGPEILIAFHGFGQTHSIFENIAPALEDRFTVYACSLFYHGESKLPDHVNPGEPIPPELFKEGVLEFCHQNNISKFSLMGYSLGGRLVLQLVELIPERINYLLLLAPDGVKKSRWYYFATNHFIGKRLFKRVVYKPKLLFALVKIFKATGIIKEKMAKFVHSQYGEEEKRLKIFNVWNTYSVITPRVRKVKANIKQHHLKTLIFTGTYDPVLDEKIGYILSVGLEDEVKWVKIEAGHDLLKPVYADLIKAELGWFNK